MSIRIRYEEVGVDAYYQVSGEDYYNPHEASVKNCLRYFYNTKEHENVFDFACGDGLATKWIGNRSNVIGCDGYLHNRYRKETKRFCYSLKFDEFCDFDNVVDDNFDLTILSYGIDLIEKSYIQTVLYRLALISKELLVIRPNNHIIKSPFWSLKGTYKDGKAKASMYVRTL